MEMWVYSNFSMRAKLIGGQTDGQIGHVNCFLSISANVTKLTKVTQQNVCKTLEFAH